MLNIMSTGPYSYPNLVHFFSETHCISFHFLIKVSYPTITNVYQTVSESSLVAKLALTQPRRTPSNIPQRTVNELLPYHSAPFLFLQCLSAVTCSNTRAILLNVEWLKLYRDKTIPQIHCVRKKEDSSFITINLAVIDLFS